MPAPTPPTNQPEGASKSPSATCGTGFQPVKNRLHTLSLTTGDVRWTLLVLALPVLGEQLLNTFVGLFDTYLAGRISADATGAIGLAAYVGWLASMIALLMVSSSAITYTVCSGSFCSC